MTKFFFPCQYLHKGLFTTWKIPQTYNFLYIMINDIPAFSAIVDKALAAVRLISHDCADILGDI